MSARWWGARAWGVLSVPCGGLGVQALVGVTEPSLPRDSYWVMEGLLLSEMAGTVRGMLQNFLDLVQT